MIPLEKRIELSIKEVEKTHTALNFDPENLYKQFQYHCALKKQEQYLQVLR